MCFQNGKYIHMSFAAPQHRNSMTIPTLSPTDTLWPKHAAISRSEVVLDALQQLEAAEDKLNDLVRARNLGWNSPRTLSHLTEGGFIDLRANLGDLVRDVVRANLSASREMLCATTRHEFGVLQQRFFCDYMSALMLGTMQLLAVARQTSRDD
jgi:hypothetical protein